MTCEHNFRALSTESYSKHEIHREDSRWREQHFYVYQLFFCTKCLAVHRVKLSDTVVTGGKTEILYAAHIHAPEA